MSGFWEYPHPFTRVLHTILPEPLRERYSTHLQARADKALEESNNLRATNPRRSERLYRRFSRLSEASEMIDLGPI